MTNPYTVPNLLTALRIVLIPAIAGLFYLPDGRGDTVAGVLFAIAGITDTLDGYVARRMGQVSHLGTFLDPVADKLIVATALVLIVSRNPVWYVTLTAAVIIGREIAISALREWMAPIGASKSVAVHMLGKLKTTVQMIAIPFLLFDGPLFGFVDTGLWGRWLIWIAAVLTVWSMVYYLQKALPEIRKRVK